MTFAKRTFAALLLCLVLLAPVTAKALEPGTPAPGFTLKSLQGEEISLADYRGRMVLLKLGTTWCPTCRELSEEIDRLGPFLKERDVVVLDVFLQDTAAMIEKYLRPGQPPMTFRALIDDGRVARAYSVFLVPRLLLIDAGQTVRFDSAGRIVSGEDLKAMVREFADTAKADGAS